MLLAPIDELLANGDVGDEQLMVKWRVRAGRGVVLFEPVLDVDAVVRVAVGGNDGVIHETTLECHVLEIFCEGTASGAVQLHAFQHAPGGSGRALPAAVGALIALKLEMKEKTKFDFFVQMVVGRDCGRRVRRVDEVLSHTINSHEH